MTTEAALRSALATLVNPHSPGCERVPCQCSRHDLFEAQHKALVAARYALALPVEDRRMQYQISWTRHKELGPGLGHPDSLAEAVEWKSELIRQGYQVQVESRTAPGPWLPLEVGK